MMPKTAEATNQVESITYHRGAIRLSGGGTTLRVGNLMGGFEPFLAVLEQSLTSQQVVTALWRAREDTRPRMH